MICLHGGGIVTVVFKTLEYLKFDIRFCASIFFHLLKLMVTKILVHWLIDKSDLPILCIATLIAVFLV